MFKYLVSLSVLTKQFLDHFGQELKLSDFDVGGLMKTLLRNLLLSHNCDLNAL